MQRMSTPAQRFIGPDVKAWLANGLEELRSVMTPNTQGVQLGNIPGTMLTPTTGEQTAARLGRDQQQDMEPTQEMPRQKERGMDMER